MVIYTENIIDYIKKYNIEIDDGEKLKWVYINNEKTNYIVSSYGYIISFNFHHRTPEPKRLKEKYKSDGYHRVTLVNNGIKYTCLVHRLVAIAFIPNLDNKPQVNHIDGNKGNNCIDNLEWVNQSENNIHSYSHGLKKPSYGNAKLSKDTVIKVCEMIENGDKNEDIINKLNISKSLFNGIKYGLTWTTISKNYKFKYKRTRIKITENEFSEIKDMLSNNISIDTISEKFGVAKTTVKNVKNSSTFNDYRKGICNRNSTESN